MTGRAGVTRRTLRTLSNIKPINPHSLTLEGNYAHNYSNVEISTRDVFAVITAIKPMKFSHSPNPTRSFKLGRRRAGEPRRTLKTFSSIKTINHYSLTLEHTQTKQLGWKMEMET